MRVYQYVSHIFLIGVVLSSCETCVQNSQPEPERPPTEQENLKEVIQGLAMKRKQAVSKLIDEWHANLPASKQLDKQLVEACKEGNLDLLREPIIEKIKKDAKDHGKTFEAYFPEQLEKLKEKGKQEGNYYGRDAWEVALLEKRLTCFFGDRGDKRVSQ